MSTLHIEQGATYVRQWKWCNPVPGSDPPVADEDDPINISSYHAHLHIRRRIADAEPLLEFSDDFGEGLIIDGPEGTVDLTITDEVTTAITARSAVWDLELEAPTGVVTRLDGGKVEVSPEVTR